ncbi:MAG: hypothetical protein ABH860_03800 [bacterium]
MKGEAYRTFGALWETENKPYLAYIWKLRAGTAFNIAEQEELVKNELKSVKANLIKNTVKLTPEDYIEHANLIKSFDNIKYKSELDELDKAIKGN